MAQRCIDGSYLSILSGAAAVSAWMIELTINDCWREFRTVMSKLPDDPGKSLGEKHGRGALCLYYI